MRRRLYKQNTKTVNDLYRFVFETKVAKFFAFALLFIFIILPAAPVFADEGESVSETPPPAEIVEPVIADPEPEINASKVKESAPVEELVASDDQLSDKDSEGDVVVVPEGEIEKLAEVDSGQDSTTESSDNITDNSQLSVQDEESNTDSEPDTVNTQSGSNSSTSTEFSDETVSETSGQATETVTGTSSSVLPVTDQSLATSSAVTTTSSTSLIQDNTALDSAPDSGDKVASTTATSSATWSEQSYSTTTKSTVTDVVVGDEVLSDTVISSSTVDLVSNDSQDVEDESDLETATSTEQTAMPPPVVVASVTNDENRHQFSETECVSVGDGSYYCSKLKASEEFHTSEFFTAKDSDGDLEIFINTSGEVKQVTHNLYDDGAPHYDSLNNELVFHRLLDGRYQIMHLDLDTNEEIQLTDTRENNMEPQQADDLIVWQYWVNDNWEIALHENGETRIITNNSYHDVAPTVRDGFIMWHTTSMDGEKLLTVYEIATGESTVINDPDGGHVENPRFVLVYDTEYDNGDVVTKEYDPATGSIRPLGSEPAPLPPELPPTDSTGETRAIIQNKTNTGKDELAEFLTKPASSSSPETTQATATTSSESGSIGSDSTLDVSASTTTPATEEKNAEQTLDLSTTTTNSALELTDYDLIIEPYEAVSTTSDSSSTSTNLAVS